MKLTLIDKEKKGFARYCPTFAKAYTCMREDVHKVVFGKKVRIGKIRHTVLWMDHDEDALLNDIIRKESGGKADARTWIKALGDVDGHIQIAAREALVNTGKPAAPALIKAAEKSENPYERLNAALALADIADGNAASLLEGILNDIDQDRTPRMQIWKLVKTEKERVAVFDALIANLSRKESFQRVCAVSCFIVAVEKGIDIAKAIEPLSKMLSDTEADVRIATCITLEKAAEKGIDIFCALPGLIKMLSESKFIGEQVSAATALCHAAKAGTDMTIAIPYLVAALSSEFKEIRQDVSNALISISRNGTDGMRTEITNGIISFVHSENFKREMYKNTVTYTSVMGDISSILVVLKKSGSKPD